MELSISNLLNNFVDDKLVAPKAIEKKMGCEDAASLKRLEIALDALEKMGILVKERGKYRRLTEDGVVEGKLRCSSKGFCFAIQDEEGTDDIYIRESQLSNAWNGDRVLVKVTKEGRRRRSPEGEVQLILERGNPSVLARVKRSERGIRGIPLDDRLLFEMELQPSPTAPDLEATLDQLVHIEIIRYPLGQYPPLGRITQVLGSDAQSAADTELVCCKYDLNRSFSDSAQKAIAALPTKLKKSDLKNRVDLRQRFTLALSATEASSTFQDHALSLEATADGGWQLIVHITDLASFVEPDSPLDREALRRGTAITLDGTIIPLLPPQTPLALDPGQERLSISVLFTLSEQGEVLEYEIQPTVIQVDLSLNGHEVESILDRHTTPVPEDLAELADSFELVDQLYALSQVLQQQRWQRGSFDLNLPHHRPQTEDEGLAGVVALGPQQRYRALLAEMLILANQTVLSHLQALGIPAVYRVQSPPDLYDVQEFIKLTTNLGIPLNLASEESVQPQDYQNFASQITNTETELVLMELLWETLKSASDSAIPGPHFALASVQGYGHICAPLHRYTDILNQRALQAMFMEGRDRKTTRAKEKVNLRHSSALGQVSWNVLPPDTQRDLEAAIAGALIQLNERERIAQQSLKDLDGLQKVKQMQQRTGEIFRGLITGIQSYGFFVEIEELMVEGLVHVSSLKDDWYEYRSRQQTLIGRKNRRQYRLGDHVEVQVKSVDYYRQQIDLVVVGGGSQASEEEMDEPVEEFDEGDRDQELD